ncbi:hypothetical protein [Nostoc sp.]|uniref:hypothetical protein n=1 Tax=Nostoc sp. TaxID=1180 RepID=UPI002FF45375
MDVCPIFISAVRQIRGFHATFYPSASGVGVQAEHYPPKVLAQLSKTDPSKILLTTKGIPNINSSAKYSKFRVAIATLEVTIISFLSDGGHTVIYIANPIISNGFPKTYPLDSHAGIQRSPLRQLRI